MNRGIGFIGKLRRRPESEQCFRQAKTAKQAISVLSSMQPDAGRRKKGRSKPDRVSRYSLMALMMGVMAVGSARAQMMTLEPNTPSTEVTLEVQVVNGTAQGTPVAGDAVKVQLYEHMALLKTLENTVSQDGRVRFEHLPAGPRKVALAQVRHADMMFSSRAIVLDPNGQGVIPCQVQVYDVSTDVNALTVGMHHLILEQKDQQLRCTEIFLLSNDSDTAVTSAKRDQQGRPIVLQVGLPRGAQQLTPMSYLEKEALVTTADGFYDTMAVPPGSHQVGFTYLIPLESKRQDLSRTFYLPTASFAIIRKGATGMLYGLGTPDKSTTDAEGVAMEQYKRTNLKPGDRVTFQIAGLPGERSDQTTWIILVVVFIGVGAVVLKRVLSSPGKAQPQKKA